MSNCPHLSELEQLLAGADKEVLSRLEQHLDACPACRDRLETIRSAAALPTVIDRLADEGGLPPHGTTAPDKKSRLSFLGPTELPGFLGRLGNYEVRRIIARGGSGMILEALDPLLKRTVAIKVLSPATVLDAENKARFLREAQSAAALTHENVVTIHAVEQIEGTPFLVLEFVAGGTLHDRVQQAGKLPLDEVVRIGAEVARGLAAAHGRGLVHRDIKPANILIVEETNRAKIADFGLAKATGEDILTAKGTLLGTPAYMSPEQALRQQLDERSDLFSLGAVLYFAATGVSPFHGGSLMETLGNVCRAEPRPLRDVDPTLPEWFCELVHRLLSKEPQDRLGWASAVAEVLDKRGSVPDLIRRLPERKAASDSTQTLATPPRDGDWRFVLVALIILTLVGAALVWLGTSGMKRSPPPEDPPSQIQPAR